MAVMIYSNQLNNTLALNSTTVAATSIQVPTFVLVDIIDNELQSDMSYTFMLKIVLFSFMLLIAVVTTLGNFVVILCFIKYKNVRTNNNYYILSLSIADLIIGLICMPFYAHNTFNNGYWSFGVTFCRIWLVIDYVAGTASVLQIVVISLDRCISVLYPIKYRSWSIRKVILLNIILVWIVAFMNYGPAIILWPIVTEILNKTVIAQDHESYECRADFRNSFYYLLIAASIEFFIPFLSITVFNCSIYWNIRSRVKKCRLSYHKLPPIRNGSMNNDTVNKVSNVGINNERPLFLKENGNSLDLGSIKNSNGSNVSRNNVGNGLSLHNRHQTVPVIKFELCSSIDKNADDSQDVEVDKQHELQSVNSIITPVEKDSYKTKQPPKSESESLLNHHMQRSNSTNTNTDVMIAHQRTRQHNNFIIPTPEELFMHLERKRRKNIERDKKISRSLALLVICFAICWLPYTLIALIDAICLNRSSNVSCINSTIFELVFWLLWLNSTINPCK